MELGNFDLNKLNLDPEKKGVFYYYFNYEGEKPMIWLRLDFHAFLHYYDHYLEFPANESIIKFNEDLEERIKVIGESFIGSRDVKSILGSCDEDTVLFLKIRDRDRDNVTIKKEVNGELSDVWFGRMFGKNKDGSCKFSIEKLGVSHNYVEVVLKVEIGYT